ncbi:hypothetical protein RQP46_006209 [Phenoliferia psychrophenolica]
MDITTTFRTERLVFRAVESSDTDIAHLGRLHADVRTQIQGIGNAPRPMSKAFAEKLSKFSGDCICSVFVCLPATPEEPETAGEVIGWMNLNPISAGAAHHRKTLFGVSLAKEHQGKGYGAEALKWLITWGFHVYGLNRIEGAVFSWNERARKLYQKLGFVEEGISRKALWQEGAFRDDVSLGLLAEDWKALQSSK